MKTFTEAQLVARLKKRDEKAFGYFVREYQGQVYRVVFRMLGNAAEAEEISQEVFITVFKSIDRFRGDSKLSTWLYRVAVNHSKNRIKYLARRAQSAKCEFDEFTEAQTLDSASMRTSGQPPRPDEMAQARQSETMIQRALAGLEPEHRELIIFRDIEGMTYQEIGTITGLIEGTVKSRLHRARLELRKCVVRLQRGGGRG